jgi:hypothetical protein
LVPGGNGGNGGNDGNGGNGNSGRGSNQLWITDNKSVSQRLISTIRPLIAQRSLIGSAGHAKLSGLLYGIEAAPDATTADSPAADAVIARVQAYREIKKQIQQVRD